MTEMTLAATVRQGTGKSVARALRRAGQLPGIIYGVGDPVPIQFDTHSAEVLVHALHGSERLISLQLADAAGAGATERHVLLKDVQATPVGAKLLHIDFHEVDVTKTVHVSVEIRAKGRAAGEKEGGILQQVTYEVSVECLPTIIPEFLELDVSELTIGDSLHVSDVAVPEGVSVLTPREETLFVVVAPRVEEEVAVAAEPGAVPVEGEEPAGAPAEGAAEAGKTADEG
ncbi:MAG TPA: 50S ribosomal protein L25 [bacterium]|jgi:large subunit ribosomal protein L25